MPALITYTALAMESESALGICTPLPEIKEESIILPGGAEVVDAYDRLQDRADLLILYCDPTDTRTTALRLCDKEAVAGKEEVADIVRNYTSQQLIKEIALHEDTLLRTATRIGRLTTIGISHITVDEANLELARLYASSTGGRN